VTEAEELKEFSAGGQESEGCGVNPKEVCGSSTIPELTQNNLVQIAHPRMWAIRGDTFSPCEGAVRSLDPGQYQIQFSHDIGIHFHRKEVNLDELLILPDSATELVLAQIEEFWTKEEHFRNLGFMWKRGIMLWGPPGGGKTSTLQLLSKQIIDHGGLSVYVVNPDLAAQGLEKLRIIEPKRPVVVMLEDIDAMVRDYGESQLLALLDGELQIDNIVFVATTNYPELLDKRLKNRPSRFDYIKKIGMPSRDARELYLTHKYNLLAKDRAEVNRWLDLTEGFSIAHLKELIISVEVFGVKVTDAATRLHTMIKANISSEQNEDRQFGFTQ